MASDPAVKVSLTRPVTIEAVEFGERWFPFVFRLTDGLLVMYVEYGHDANWSPFVRFESRDGGRTWGNRTDNVPRVNWCHSFADGELYEIDCYGVQDPRRPAEAAYYAAWSRPGAVGAPVRKELTRIHCPSTKPVCLTDMRGYPMNDWWPLWNGLHQNEELTGKEVFLTGPCITSGVAMPDGRLLAVGYWPPREAAGPGDGVWLLESGDRGRTWREVGTVALPGPDYPVGFNETTLLRLPTGRLLAISRAHGPLYQMWSDDEGRTWTAPQPLRLVDGGPEPYGVWPVAKVLHDGTLALVYGRPGKHLVFDPTGTGEQWGSHVDLHAWELETQALLGVPPELRLRGIVGHDLTKYCNRHTDSSDYLALVEVAPGELRLFYDVQGYHEHWNARPVSAVRMVRLHYTR
jgi:hypothetical protein